MYFDYTIDPNAEEPIMLILKQIGNSYDEYGNVVEYGVNGEQFCKEMLMLDNMGKSRIQVWINSVGGSVVDGYSILGAMLKTKAKVDTYNIGVAASTAGWLFQAGRNRDMSDYATWMGHNPYTADGSESAILTKFRESIIQIIAQRTGMSNDEVGVMLDKETYLNATECKDLGFCDSITPTSKVNVKRMQQKSSVLDKWKEAEIIVNSLNIKPTVKKPIMEFNNKIDASITNKLNLDADASPAMVSKAISDLQNKLTVETAKTADAESALQVANKEKSDLQKKYDNLSKEMDKIKQEMAEQEAADRCKNATDMVNSFVEMGKIANQKDIIEGWIADASESREAFEKIKNRLETLPVNKEAKKIEVVNVISTGAPKNIDQIMLDIAKKNNQK